MNLEIKPLNPYIRKTTYTNSFSNQRITEINVDNLVKTFEEYEEKVKDIEVACFKLNTEQDQLKEELARLKDRIKRLEEKVLSIHPLDDSMWERTSYTQPHRSGMRGSNDQEHSREIRERDQKYLREIGLEPQ